MLSLVAGFEVLCMQRTHFPAASCSAEITGRNLNQLPEVSLDLCSRRNILPLLLLLHLSLHFQWHWGSMCWALSLDERMTEPRGNVAFCNTLGWSLKLSQIAAVAFYCRQFNSKFYKEFPCSLQHGKIQSVNDCKIPPASCMAD